jgi:putative DNA primase/helicase
MSDALRAGKKPDLSNCSGREDTACASASCAAPLQLVGAEDSAGDEWIEEFDRGKDGRPKATQLNVELALRNDCGLDGLLEYDAFQGAVVFSRPPPWIGMYSASKSVKAGDAFTDDDETRLSGYLSRTHGMNEGKGNKLDAFIGVVAKDSTFHPVERYLRSLEWDGVRRMQDWLAVFLGVAPSEYAAKVGAWWLLSAVARVLRPGCQADHILVLEGDQGLRKTSALRTLGGDYFSDPDLGDLGNKESSLLLQGKWILELAEGEIFSRASAQALKGFISKLNDDLILKYANRGTRYARQCVFALTTNDLSSYLTDPTGNRRYWPVLCREVDIAGLSAARDQLWAEATAMFDAGDRWWPHTPEEVSLCEEQQNLRREQDPWEADIQAALDTRERITIPEILRDVVHLDTAKHDRQKTLRVSKILRGLALEQVTRSGSVRYWTRTPRAKPQVEMSVAEKIAQLKGRPTE